MHPPANFLVGAARRGAPREGGPDETIDERSDLGGFAVDAGLRGRPGSGHRRERVRTCSGGGGTAAGGGLGRRPQSRHRRDADGGHGCLGRLLAPGAHRGKLRVHGRHAGIRDGGPLGREDLDRPAFDPRLFAQALGRRGDGDRRWGSPDRRNDQKLHRGVDLEAADRPASPARARLREPRCPRARNHPERDGWNLHLRRRQLRSQQHVSHRRREQRPGRARGHPWRLFPGRDRGIRGSLELVLGSVRPGLRSDRQRHHPLGWERLSRAGLRLLPGRRSDRERSLCGRRRDPLRSVDRERFPVGPDREGQGLLLRFLRGDVAQRDSGRGCRPGDARVPGTRNSDHFSERSHRAARRLQARLPPDQQPDADVSLPVGRSEGDEHPASGTRRSGACSPARRGPRSRPTTPTTR